MRAISFSDQTLLTPAARSAGFRQSWKLPGNWTTWA